MKGKKLQKAILILTALLMLFGAAPSVFAADPLTQVHVIVDNNTFSEEDGAAWSGTLVDTWVTIDNDSTAMSCLVEALGEHTQEGAESNYISSIDGLEAASDPDPDTYDGWMFTLNDWFTNEGAGAYTVANSGLAAGDVIHFSYSLTMGEDLGGSWGNNLKTLSDVTFSTGTLSEAFSADTHAYTLEVPKGIAALTVTPTASNKNFQVHTYLGTQEAGTEYRRTAQVPVTDGSVITVVCGDSSWPTMNSASDVPKETYTFTVKEKEAAQLKSLIIHTGTSPLDDNVLLKNSTDTYSSGDTFDPAVTSYTLAAQTDTLTQLRFRAEAEEEGSVVKVNYYNGSKDITWSSGSSKWANCLTGGKNVFTITVTPPQGSSKGEATYTFTVNCAPSITALSVESGGYPRYLDTKFVSTTHEYTVDVPADATSVTVNATPKNAAYSLNYDGGASNEVDIQSINKFDVVVTAGSEDTALSTTYTINLNKIAVATFKPSVTPSDALINVYDSLGVKLNPESDGSFKGIFASGDYTYTITKFGYIAQTGNVPQEGGTPTVTLSEAPDDGLSDVSAYWHNFRNSDTNMAIMDVKTPISADDTALLWNQKLGTGWSAAPSLPLIVDDSLVVMVNTEIVKLDLKSGEVLAKGDMITKSSWGTMAMAYGDGKIFCSLSNGYVQAFDAKTLKSLWIYKDSLGGQDQAYITYSDGYVYTSHWNSYTADANFVCISSTDEDPSKTDEAKVASWLHTNTGGYYWAGSAVVGDYVIVGGENGTTDLSGTATIKVLNKLNGKLLSTLPLPGLDDQRSGIAYDDIGKRIYFTTNGGYICSASLNTVTGELSDLKSALPYDGAASTSTPVVYKGRVYFGVGKGFAAGDQQNFVAADATTLETVFMVNLKAYPQCSMLLSTAYEDTGYLYFYSTYNANPGGISLIKVKTNASSAADAELIELYDAAGFSQYCIASVICGEDGTLYYKNDSCNVMAVGFKEYAKVITMIDEIGDVTLDDEAAITEARSAYDALSEEDKEKVTNYSALTEAETTLADIKAANSVIALINDIGEVNKNSGNKITAAREAYDALSSAAKALVTNYDTLTKAEDDYYPLIAASAEVTASYQEENIFLLLPQKLTVNAYLAESYGYADSVDFTKNVSALDVLVAMHEKLYGSSFTKEDCKESLVVSAGSISKAFGTESNNFGFTINELCPNDGVYNAGYGGYTGLTVNQAKAVDNDNVRFMLYQDSMWMDFESWFEYGGAKVHSIELLKGKTYQINVKGYMLMWDGFSDKLDEKITGIEDAQLTTVDEYGMTTDITGALCDENGMAEISFDTAGTYNISAWSDGEENYVYIFSPWLTVTVKEPTADEAEAIAVEKQIADITDPATLSDETAVTAARNAYDALDEEQKALVSNLSKLEEAEERVDSLKAIKDVTDKIDAIGDVTLSDEAAITEARSAYNALSADEKSAVGNYDELEAAETALADLKAAKAVDDKIEAIGTAESITAENVTDKAAKALEARSAYDKLSDAQKALVTKLAALTAAEAKITPAQNAAAVEALIDKMPQAAEVNFDNAAKVKEAYDAYEALTDEAKPLLSAAKKNTLDAAKAAYDALYEDIKAAEALVDALPSGLNNENANDNTMTELFKAFEAYEALSQDEKENFDGEQLNKYNSLIEQAEAINHSSGTAEIKGLPWYIRIEAAKLKSDELSAGMLENIGTQSVLSALDIKLYRYTASGKVDYTFTGEVDLDISVADLDNYKDINIYHEKSGGNIEKPAYTQNGNVLSIKITSTSPYTVSGTYANASPKTSDSLTFMWAAAAAALAALGALAIAAKRKKA